MLEEYIATCGKRLYGLCLHLVTNKSDADDLYQETWLKIHHAWGRYDPNQEFMAWASRICINAYRDMLRRNRMEKLLMYFDTDDEQERTMERIAVTDRYSVEFEQIYTAIAQLPDRYRIVIILHYYQQLTTKEMATTLHLPEGTVKYRLVKARELLKGRIDGWMI